MCQQGRSKDLRERNFLSQFKWRTVSARMRLGAVTFWSPEHRRCLRTNAIASEILLPPHEIKCLLFGEGVKGYIYLLVLAEARRLLLCSAGRPLAQSMRKLRLVVPALCGQWTAYRCLPRSLVSSWVLLLTIPADVSAFS